MVYIRLTGAGAMQVAASYFQDFLNQIKRGEIRQEIAKFFLLREIVDAHKLMESNQAKAKVEIKI